MLAHPVLHHQGGQNPGVHGRTRNGKYFEILYGEFTQKDDNEETTGLAFSPDGQHMYVAFQNIGIIYDITRDDKRPFQGGTSRITTECRSLKYLKMVLTPRPVH
jgi:secreted PhoX family phosphatase